MSKFAKVLILLTRLALAKTLRLNYLDRHGYVVAHSVRDYKNKIDRGRLGALLAYYDLNTTISISYFQIPYCLFENLIPFPRL